MSYERIKDDTEKSAFKHPKSHTDYVSAAPPNLLTVPETEGS